MQPARAPASLPHDPALLETSGCPITALKRPPPGSAAANRTLRETLKNRTSRRIAEDAGNGTGEAVFRCDRCAGAGHNAGDGRARRQRRPIASARIWTGASRAARRSIEQGDQNAADLSYAYAMRALAYSLKGRYETAIRDYDMAISMKPDFAVALNNRAWALFRWGKATEGLPDVERSLELSPASAHSSGHPRPHQAGAGRSQGGVARL